jgi:hypothetical protein
MRLHAVTREQNLSTPFSSPACLYANLSGQMKRLKIFDWTFPTMTSSPDHARTQYWKPLHSLFPYFHSPILNKEGTRASGYETTTS